MYRTQSVDDIEKNKQKQTEHRSEQENDNDLHSQTMTGNADTDKALAHCLLQYKTMNNKQANKKQCGATAHNA